MKTLLKENIGEHTAVGLARPHAADDAMTNLKKTAHITGFLYFGLAIASALGFLLVPPELHVDGNAAATAKNLVDHVGLARLGVALELGIVLTQALAAVWFYKLFRALNSFAAGSLAANNQRTEPAGDRWRTLDDRLLAVRWATTTDGFVVGFTRGRRPQPWGPMSQRLDVRAVRCGRRRRTAIHQTNQQEAQNHMVGASTVQSVCPHNTRGILAEMRHRVHVAAPLVRWTVR